MSKTRAEILEKKIVLAEVLRLSDRIHDYIIPEIRSTEYRINADQKMLESLKIELKASNKNLDTLLKHSSIDIALSKREHISRQLDQLAQELEALEIKAKIEDDFLRADRIASKLR